MTEVIVQHIKKEHKLAVGDNSAEVIKLQLGSAYPIDDEQETIEVSGVYLLSGLPKTVTLSAKEIRECMSEPVNSIINAVKRTLENTPPDLAADIIDRGIMLAGGGALLRGLDTLLSQETGIVTHIAADPLRCVVLGTGIVLEDKSLNRVFIDRSVLA